MRSPTHALASGPTYHLNNKIIIIIKKAVRKLTRVPAKCEILNLVFQWSNTNLKTKPKPLVPFASQNNAPTFLGRKSVLTSMIHRASRPQAEDSGFPPHTGSAGGRPPSNRPLRGLPPAAGSPRARTSQCDVLWISLQSGGKRTEDASLQEQPGDIRPDSLRWDTPWRSKKERLGKKPPPHTHSSDQRNTPTSQRGLAIPGHRKALAPGGRYGTERNCV